MDVYLTYNLATSAWLTTQALPLLFSPGVIVSLLSPEPRSATDLESYFARTTSLALLAFALLTLSLSGVLPTSADPDSSTGAQPYAVPTLVVTTTYHAAAGVYGYLTWSSGETGASAALGALVSAGLALVGGWCLLFGQDRGHLSRRTGADKRTSGWPFKNDVAAQKRGGSKAL